MFPLFYAVLPDFSQVYSFIGSVFDPDVTGHLQKLKKMDPIDVDTVFLFSFLISCIICLGFDCSVYDLFVF